MKVAITGHTSGLGKGLYEQLGALGHEVIGFSTSTGCDINNELNRRTIIGVCQDFDLFINNAYGWIEPNIPSVKAFAKLSEQQRTETPTPTELGQVRLFEMFNELWEGDNTKHINKETIDAQTRASQGTDPRVDRLWFMCLR